MRAGYLVLLLTLLPAAAADANAWTEPVSYVKGVALFLVLLTAVTLLLGRDLSDRRKKLLFLLYAVPVLASSLFLAGATIAENVHSVTKGPVHWHADYQVWVCGERLDLTDPSFPRNKIGTPLFHEHDDDRIHVEGTVGELGDVDLGSYFAVVGGALTGTSLTYPTVHGTQTVTDGDDCRGAPAELAVYVNGRRVEEPEHHLMYPDAYVPPGDCIIVEFAPSPAETTDRLCESWAAEDWTYDSYEREPRGVGDVTWQ